MPVLNQTPKNTYIANGSVTVFPYTFRVTTANSLKVMVDKVLLSSGFTITDIGVENGGTVVFDEPPIAGVEVFLYRYTDRARNTDYIEAGPLAADDLDNDFNRLNDIVAEIEASTIQTVGSDTYDAQDHRIINVLDPVDPQDAVTKAWAETGMSSQLALATSAQQNVQMLANAAGDSAEWASHMNAEATTQYVAAYAARSAAEEFRDEASASATTATTAAGTATTQAGIATTKASEANLSAVNAEIAKTLAESALTNTEAIRDNFDKYWLGPKATPPVSDNGGNTLLEGAFYFNTTSDELQVWNGASWQGGVTVGYVLPSALASINGLTTAADRMIYTTAPGVYAVTPLTSAARSVLDDTSIANMRTTLGLGTIATQASTSVAVTGGNINGTAIGATTPAAGTFTSLGVGGTLTMNSNGIVQHDGTHMYVRPTNAGAMFLGANNQHALSLFAANAAVNYFNISAQPTGGTPIFSAYGADTNIGISYATKGTGQHGFTGDVQFNGNVGMGTAPSGTAGSKLLVREDHALPTSIYVRNGHAANGAVARFALDMPSVANAYALMDLNYNSGAPYYNVAVGSGVASYRSQAPEYYIQNASGVTKLQITDTAVTASVPVVVPNETAGANNSNAANTAYVDGAVRGRWTTSAVTSLLGLNTWNGSVPNWATHIKIHFNAQNATANTISLRLGHAGGIVSSALYYYGMFYGTTNVQPANNTMFPIQALSASSWCRGVIELTRQAANPGTPSSQWLVETKMMMGGRSTTLIGDVTIPGLLTQYIIAPSAGSWGSDSTIWIEYS